MNSVHLVLDLDECLGEVYSDKWYLYKQIITDPDIADLRNRVVYMEYLDSNDKLVKMWGIKRPYLQEFLRFCFMYFDTVSVWSAGVQSYVNAVTKALFRDVADPYIVLHRGSVQSNPFLRGDYWKPLSKYYPHNQNASPSNTLMLDNKMDNFRRNPVNGVHIPDYSPRGILDPQDKDKFLLMFQQFLMTNNVSNVNKINHNDIFRQNTRTTNSTPTTKYTRFRENVTV